VITTSDLALRFQERLRRIVHEAAEQREVPTTLTLIIAIHLEQELYRDGSRGEEAPGMEQMRLGEACELSTADSRARRAHAWPRIAPDLSRRGNGR
jgi:hypothetical protein